MLVEGDGKVRVVACFDVPEQLCGGGELGDGAG